MTAHYSPIVIFETNGLTKGMAPFKQSITAKWYTVPESTGGQPLFKWWALMKLSVDYKLLKAPVAVLILLNPLPGWLLTLQSLPYPFSYWLLTLISPPCLPKTSPLIPRTLECILFLLLNVSHTLPA